MKQSKNLEINMKVGDNMNERFEDKMKNDFTSYTPDVLSKIKQSSRFKIPEAPQRRSLLDIFKLRKVRYTFASLFVVVLLTVAFLNQPAEQIYASTVTLDLNPQFEITLDEEDKVIDIIALNDDGSEIIDALGKYKREEIQVIIEKMVQSLQQNGYLNQEENSIMVYVEGVNEQVQVRVQAFVENKLQQEASKYQKTFEFVRRNNLDYNQTELNRINEFSQETKIHPGRVILILEIRDVDDSYTVEDLRGMSMRDLYNLYNTLYPDENPDDPGTGNTGNGNN